MALVLFMKDIEPAIYLIPVKVWETPDQIFIDNDQGERLKHMSNWEIKIFTRGIQELSKYAFGRNGRRKIQVTNGSNIRCYRTC